MLDDFSTAMQDICDAWPALMPPNRLRVSEGAAKVLKISRPGSSATFWSAEETPYMVEPMDTLASRVHSAVVFAGPAQSGKTLGLGEGWMAHAVVHDPGDMLIVQMSQDKAREYSKQRIDRAIRNSPALRDLLGRAQDDNTHDKLFRNGMWVKIAWPTVTNLSSTSYRYVFLTDYDRVGDDIDGEGDMFTLGGKRTTTFLSRGMLAAESSPGRPVVDPKWRPATPHEAPSVGGILGIYNRSDRRRLYWKCPHCAAWFQATPGLGLFHLPKDDEILLDVRKADLQKMAAQYARVICPNSGCVIGFDMRNWMAKHAVWLRDGQSLTDDDRVEGEGRTSSIAGFWLGGVAAAYTTWNELILKHLQALQEFALTGSELPLQTTANTDQGIPYLSRHLAEASELVAPVERVDSTLNRFIVPEWTRCVLASVDVQGGKRARFVVQVHAVGPFGEQALVDRYELRWSKRPGMGDEFAPLDPAAHPEDWDVLTDKVVNCTYRTPQEGVEIRVYKTAVDTGGEDGVTNNAYAWLRRLKLQGLANRVRLVKGNNTPTEWFTRETMVGGKQGQGDVSLHLLNTNRLKDMVDNSLKRQAPGPGYLHFPAWLEDSFFDELQAEVRDERGRWEQIKPRNESFDLCCYIRALIVMLGIDKVRDWENVPAWLKPLELNSEAISREERQARQEAAKDVSPVRHRAPRRVVRSGYLG